MLDCFLGDVGCLVDLGRWDLRVDGGRGRIDLVGGCITQIIAEVISGGRALDAALGLETEWDLVVDGVSRRWICVHCIGRGGGRP